MINSIRIKNLRSNEALQFFNDVLNRCTRFDISTLMLEPVTNGLQQIVIRLEDVYNKEKGSVITQKLSDSDGKRDNAFTGIRTVCEGYTYMSDENISTAAQNILESIDRHGKSINRLNYQAQTAVIDAIVDEWKNETELNQALQTLNLTGWVEILEKENQNFSNYYQDRVDDQLKTAGASFTELKGEAINKYDALCDTIFAYSVINDNEVYDQLANAINLIIADYNAILTMRESSKEIEAGE